MNDGDFETYDPRDPYGYAAEDEHFLLTRGRSRTTPRRSPKRARSPRSTPPR
jgi:hypothetical protein